MFNPHLAVVGVHLSTFSTFMQCYQCNAESAVKSSEEGINQPKTSKAERSTLKVATALVVQGYILVQMIIKDEQSVSPHCIALEQICRHFIYHERPRYQFTFNTPAPILHMHIADAYNPIETAMLNLTSFFSTC